MNIRKFMSFWLLVTIFGFAQAEEQNGLSNKIEKIDFSTLSGGRVAIRIQTAQPIANPPPGFTLNNPPRIALDFPDTANGLNKTSLDVDQGPLKSISIAQAKERTRMVLNLSKAVTYNTTTEGNQATIILQGDAISAQAA